MHHQTAWTKKASSLPSDRIPAKPKPPPSSKAKSTNKASEPPKSKAVRDLELILSAVRNEKNSSIPDPKGGCFCQARMHPLSSYSTMCLSCGLALCILNLPCYACPHCTSSLLVGPSARPKLLTRLETEISDTLAGEDAERVREEEEARRMAGAFPSLPPSSAPLLCHPQARNVHPPSSQHPQAHKVLSLNPKTKRATLTTTTTTISRVSRTGTPTPSRPNSPPITRVPPPPGADVLCARERIRPERPWQNLGLKWEGREFVYIPPAGEN